MHELALAQNILDIVHGNVPPADLPRVAHIALVVGEQSGVVPASLSFCLEALCDRTPLQHSRVTIAIEPYVLRCTSCGIVSRQPAGWASCAACGGRETSVMSGVDVRVQSIHLADDVVETV